MEEQIKVIVKVEAVLIIDRDVWPDDWNLIKEMAHQMSFSDAEECEIKEVTIVSG